MLILLNIVCSKDKEVEIRPFEENIFGILIANYENGHNNSKRMQEMKDSLNYHLPKDINSLNLIDEYTELIEIQSVNRTILSEEYNEIGKTKNVALFVLLQVVNENTIKIYIARKDISYEIADNFLCIVEKENKKYHKLMQNISSLYKLSISLDLQKNRRFEEADSLLKKVSPLSTKNNNNFDV